MENALMSQHPLVNDITRYPSETISQTTPLLPSWSLDFTKQSPASAGLTFSRASSAGYYDKNGAWAVALTDTLRIGYHPATGQPLGFVCEESRTNYLLNSSTPVSQTVNLGTGTYTLWLEGSGTCLCAAGSAVGSGFGSASGASAVVFTLTTAGTVIFTVTGSVTRFQCEKGATATSFITTTTASATRSADVATTNLSQVLNAAEGTFLITGSLGTGMFLGLDNGTGDHLTRLHFKGSSEERNIFCSIGGTIKGTYSDFTLLSGGTLCSIGFTYAAGGLRGVINGATINSSPNNTSGITVPVLRVGHRSLSGGLRDYLNGSIQRISYFNKALSQEQLQLLAI